MKNRHCMKRQIKEKLFKSCYCWFTSGIEGNSHNEEFSFGAEGCCVATLRHRTNIKGNCCYKQVSWKNESHLFVCLHYLQAGDGFTSLFFTRNSWCEHIVVFMIAGPQCCSHYSFLAICAACWILNHAPGMMPLQHQLSLGIQKTFPFYLLLANHLQKAQHCLNNKKGFTDGHKSKRILMNIYSHRFSWLHFLRILTHKHFCK